MKSKILLGDIASFSNGKISPDRDDNAKFNVYGSNGIIGKSNNTNAKESTIIIGRVGSYCGSVYFSKDKCWVTDNAIKCEAKDDNNPSFIYYQALKLNLNNFRVGSGQPLLNQGILKNLEIAYVSPDKQQKIAHILSTIDDKIELNRKMNQTLEEMAQALFKSWFVDFDPVHVKMGCANDEELEAAAHELGISKEVLELFPSEFKESELGMIPAGWEIQSIYDVANIVYGAPFSSKNFNDTQTGRPLIRIRDLKTFNSQHWTEEEHVKGTLIKAGDLLIGMDAEFTPTIWQGIDGWLNQRVLKVVPINGTFTAFQYFALKPKMRFFEQANVGTTVIHLGKKDIDTIKILVPSREILEQSGLILEPLFKQLVHNSQQNRNLQNTRDTLLPKLLSGELDVSELEMETL